MEEVDLSARRKGTHHRAVPRGGSKHKKQQGKKNSLCVGNQTRYLNGKKKFRKLTFSEKMIDSFHLLKINMLILPHLSFKCFHHLNTWLLGSMILASSIYQYILKSWIYCTYICWIKKKMLDDILVYLWHFLPCRAATISYVWLLILPCYVISD